jgi:hypothetical protein
MMMVHRVFSKGFRPGRNVAHSGAGFLCWLRSHKICAVYAIELERMVCCFVVHGRRMPALFRNSVLKVTY